jgi:hypothetical protein
VLVDRRTQSHRVKEEGCYCSAKTYRSGARLDPGTWNTDTNWRDSLGGDPVFRRLKDDEVVRAASANRNTVKALEEHDLIGQAKGNDPLKIVFGFEGQDKKVTRIMRSVASSRSGMYAPPFVHSTKYSGRSRCSRGACEVVQPNPLR